MEKTKDMKKYLLGILTAMMMAGCSEDVLLEQPSDKDFIEGMPVFTASAEQNGDSRAVLTNDLHINWEKGDQISAFNKTTDNLQYQLEGEGGKTTGTFKAVATSTTAVSTWSYYGAIYPYNENNKAEAAEGGLKLTYTIPATQTYTENSFDKAAFPMLAVSSTQDFSFKNVCGVLKLQLTGTEKVKSITVTGNNDEDLAGTGTTSLTAAGELGTWSATETSKTVILNCGGVQLKADVATTFHIVLPPTEFTKGFTVKVRADGKIATLSTNNARSIKKNGILKMSQIACDFKVASQAKLVKGSTFDSKIPNATKLTFKPNSDKTGTDEQLVSLEGSTPAAYIIADESTPDVTTDYLVVTTADEFLFNADCKEMFKNDGSIVNPSHQLKEIILNGCNTSEVTNMSGMFYDCHVLTTLDVSNFDTGKVTNMSSMFNGCTALTTLDVSRFDTGNVTDMSNMFSECHVLTTLDVSRFDTRKVTVMDYMFSKCFALEELDVSSFNTSEVMFMRGMFVDCNALTSLNLSNFNTSKVIDMAFMFHKLGSSTAGTALTLPRTMTTEYLYSYNDMFTDAKLKSITCTSDMKNWILTEKKNNWNDRYGEGQSESAKLGKEGITTTWYDITKPSEGGGYEELP